MKKTLLIDGVEISFDRIRPGGEEVEVCLEGKSFTFTRQGDDLVTPSGKRLGVKWAASALEEGGHMQLGGRILRVQEVRGPGESSASAAGGPEYQAPMPGKVLKLFVQPGDAVQKGDPFLFWRR